MAGVQALLPDERTRIGGTNVALVDPVAEPPLAVGAGAVVSPPQQGRTCVGAASHEAAPTINQVDLDDDPHVQGGAV